MPKLVNRNGHGVRTVDENGVEHRLRAGQVKDLSGAAADALKGVSGVDSAKKEDEEAWDAYSANASGRADTEGQGTLVTVQGHLAEARIAGRLATVVIPLNEVVGDNDAPYGPPSGTITTKQAVARESQENKEAFSDHEWLPEKSDDEGLSDIEQRQAEARRELEEVHNSVAEDVPNYETSGSVSASSNSPDDE